MFFTQEALDFLFENRVMDSSIWFNDNREKYISLIKEPMHKLINELAPEVSKIDPLIITKPSRCISRIRRDTRFTHDKTLYRDVVWGVFMRDKKLFPCPPGLFFEFWPSGFRYGCGYYNSDSKTMEMMRQLILEGNRSFKKAKRAMEKQKIFKIEGDMYKRSRYKDQPEDLRFWLDRKNILAARTFDSPEILFFDNLKDTLIDGFNLLKPLYDFICEANDRRLQMI